MIQNNSTLVNNFWFDVVMPVLGSQDWHLLTLFLYKNTLSVSQIDEAMAESGVNVVTSLKRLEDQGLIYKESPNYVLASDENKIKIKRKKAKQVKAEIEFETVDQVNEDVINWQNFLKSVPMQNHVREILWRVYVATERDINNPWANITDINQWLKDAKTCWDLAEQNMEIISKSIVELKSKGFLIASPKSLQKTILWMKPKLENIEDNSTNVGGWF